MTAAVSTEVIEWELVYDGCDRDSVRRMRVPGGWLYQVESDRAVTAPAFFAWHPPVFVPDAEASP